MSATAESIKCPNCGGGLAIAAKTCDYCDSPVVISSFQSVFQMPLPQLNKYVRSYTEQSAAPGGEVFDQSLGMCFLKLKDFKRALQVFEKIIDTDFSNADAYLYASVALLEGKKPFTTLRPTIDKILQYLEAANSIKPSALYTYFHAYIKLDYFQRKFFNVPPPFAVVMAQANQMGISEHDRVQFFQLIGQDRPPQM